MTVGTPAGGADGGAAYVASGGDDDDAGAATDVIRADAGAADATLATSGFITAVSPVSGDVQGGTAMTLTGSFPDATYTITLGQVPCDAVNKVDDSTLTCVSGSSDLTEGTVDVTATGPSGQLLKADAYRYACLWTWGDAGATSCGARPPLIKVPAETDVQVVTTFQAGHGFTASGAAVANLNDTSDFVLGTQSASIRTDGAKTTAYLSHTGLPAMDFTGKNPKIWVKVDDYLHATKLDVDLGDAGFASYFRCRFQSTVEQPYTSEGDWVAFSFELGGSSCTSSGSPNRAAITALRFLAADNGAGPVTLHVNGVSMVDDMSARHPNGVVTFSFDDGSVTHLAAASVLQANGMVGTAYIIADLIGSGSNYLTLSDLKTMQNTMGWEVSAHSYSDMIHGATFPATPAFDLEQDIVTNRAWILSNGFNGVDDSAYPHGTYNVGGTTDVLGLMRKYYAVTRTTYSQMQETYPPSDPAKLRTYLVTESDTAESLEVLVDEAIASRQWLIFTMHHVLDPVTNDIDFSMVEFTKLAAYVKSKPIEVKTVLQMIQEP